MTIGESLKRARKKLNLELEEVAERTKIAKMFLIALENDDISSLPSGVYARNFLRTYAKFLQLDEDILTSEYHDQFQIKPHFVAHQEQTKLDDHQFRQSRRRMFFWVFILLVIAGAVTYIFLSPNGAGIRAWFSKQETAETSTASEPSPSADVEQAASGQPTQSADEENQAVNASEADSTAADSTAADSTAADSTAADSTDGTDQMPSAEPAGQDGASETVDDVNENSPFVESAMDEPESQGGGEASNQGAGESSGDNQMDDSNDTLLEEPTQELPVDSVDDITWTQPERPAPVISAMFALQAKGFVWIEVVIDGVVATRRNLQPGQVRFYHYGNYNTVRIGDASRVSIQDGDQYRGDLGDEGVTILAENFRQGELLRVVDEKLNAVDSAEE